MTHPPIPASEHLRRTLDGQEQSDPVLLAAWAKGTLAELDVTRRQLDSVQLLAESLQRLVDYPSTADAYPGEVVKAIRHTAIQLNCALATSVVLGAERTPDGARREHFSSGESATSWHAIRLFDGADVFDANVIVRQYDVEHPAECHALPEGAACWFDRYMEQQPLPGFPEWPTGVGTYRMRLETRITGGFEEPDYGTFLAVEPVIVTDEINRSVAPEFKAEAFGLLDGLGKRLRADGHIPAKAEPTAQPEDLGTFERLTDAPTSTSVRYMGDNLDELKQLLEGHVRMFMPPHPDDTLHTVTIQWNNGHFARIDKAMTVSYQDGNWQLEYGRPGLASLAIEQPETGGE